MAKSKGHSKHDPHAQREAGKYDNPIASREHILDLLAEAGEPMTRQQLAEVLALHDPDEIEALRRRLRAMERDGQVIRNRRDGYGPLDKMDMVRGRIQAHPDGFGFMIPDDGSDDLFMSAREMRALMHRDRVVARVTGMDRRGRREGMVVEVLERNTHQVVGRFQRDDAMAFVVPDNKRIVHDVAVLPEDEGGAEHGQIVLVELVQQPSRRRQPMGRVIETLGDHMAPGMEIDIALRSHELPHHWPDAVEDEIAALKPEVPESAKQGREDIRDLPLVTIDGADARDFDDAVYCEPHGGKDWRLLVAIADVSHYVDIDSALDKEAVERGNSVYFPGRVIPMLPEVLSNGLCSINPKVDRLCMVCEMIVGSGGKVKSHRFFEGLMRSHARLTYDQVAAMLKHEGVTDEGPDDGEALCAEFAQQLPHLKNLYKLYRAFDRRRKGRGAIEFDTTETTIVFGEGQKIDCIVPLTRNCAHKMIEECMIAANVEAAKFLAKNDMPTLYRIHETPKKEKLADLRAFLSELGLDLPGGDKPEAQNYAAVLAAAQLRPDAHLIQTVMLRSLNQAVYNPENKGHFGLSLGEYAHFTSPIRRYPDLLVHRGIRHVLRSGAADEQSGVARMKRVLKKLVGGGKVAENFHYTNSDMQSLGERCSLTERRADEATRDVTDWLKCEYVMDKVGEDFDGIVTSVLGFGLFVELADIYVEGLVHITSLRNDYYHFDAAKHTLSGEHNRQTYSLGSKVRVRVARVDLDDKKIDFEMLDDEGDSLPTTRPSRGGKKGARKSAAKKSGESAEKGADSDTAKPKAKRKRRKKPTKKSADKPAADTSTMAAANDEPKTADEGSDVVKKKRRRRRRKPKAQPKSDE
ncbi:MAG: ribonuclease R [Gammaproteobacteria bacterium]|nr:ribonuclease R [Gammaproteobacteria bacterium]